MILNTINVRWSYFSNSIFVFSNTFNHHSNDVHKIKMFIKLFMKKIEKIQILSIF